MNIELFLNLISFLIPLSGTIYAIYVYQKLSNVASPGYVSPFFTSAFFRALIILIFTSFLFTLSMYLQLLFEIEHFPNFINISKIIQLLALTTLILVFYSLHHISTKKAYQ